MTKQEAIEKALEYARATFTGDPEVWLATLLPLDFSEEKDCLPGATLEEMRAWFPKETEWLLRWRGKWEVFLEWPEVQSRVPDSLWELAKKCGVVQGYCGAHLFVDDKSGQVEVGELRPWVEPENGDSSLAD